jgi:hypothetical protein
MHEPQAPRTRKEVLDTEGLELKEGAYQVCTGGAWWGQSLGLRMGFMKEDPRGRKQVGVGQNTPVGHSALLRDGVTPHGEAHTHNGASNEDQEDHKGADQEVQESVEEGAATRMRDRHWGERQLEVPYPRQFTLTQRAVKPLFPS